MIIIDTHIWVWWVQNDPQLTTEYQQCLQSDLSKSESANEVWEAYLQSEEEREEVYQRLANS